MCIRDSPDIAAAIHQELGRQREGLELIASENFVSPAVLEACLLYTSDAADERSSVDLGGRRIIKKKTIT